MVLAVDFQQKMIHRRILFAIRDEIIIERDKLRGLSAGIEHAGSRFQKFLYERILDYNGQRIVVLGIRAPFEKMCKFSENFYMMIVERRC